MALGRRTFFRKGILGISGMMLLPSFVHSNESSSPEKIEDFRIGLVGCGSRGRSNGHEFAKLGKIVGLCDVDDAHVASYQQDKMISPDPDKMQTTRDYRELLDRKDIDIISISTVDHWHVKIAAEALDAGKHVFCEKPLTFSLAESKYIRERAAKSKLSFLVGTQQRTMKDHFMTATLMVRKGLLGEVNKVTVYLTPGPSGGPFEVEPVPTSLDWDRWLGQAPFTEYMAKRCHRSFRYWYEYAGGLLTDWGAHHIDCAQWALEEDKPGCGPLEIDGREVAHATELDKNGYPLRSDVFNTSTTFNIQCRFASGTQLEVVSAKDNGIIFEGTKGRIFVNRGKLTGKPIEEGVHKQLTSDDFVQLNYGKPVESPKANFLRCIREGGLPSSDVSSHTIAMNTCHLCSIAARLNRVVHWNPQTEQIINDEQAAAFMAPAPRKGFELPQ